MDRILLATGDKPEIVIETVGGDLRLTGWERGEFLAEANQDRSLYAEAGEERLTFRADAEHGTKYHQRFLAYLHDLQDRDLTLGIAMSTSR